MVLTSTISQLFEYLRDAEITQHGVELSAPVHDVTHDSRLVQPGSIFVALSGEYFDGHRFFAEVVENGAVALVGSRSLADLNKEEISIPAGVPYAQVPNARHALAQLAAAFYGFPSRSMTVIGITGTDGKTTTANILESILVAATRSPDFPNGRVGVISTVAARMCGRESDTGFHVTTPDAPAVQRYLAEMLEAGCEFAIIESTSQGLAQSRVDAVDFDVAAVTNITHEHIDWHGSRAAYIDAKAELFRKLFRTDEEQLDDPARPPLEHNSPGPHRFAILNADDRGTPDYPGSYEALTSVLTHMAKTSSADVQIHRYQMNENEDTGAPEAMAWAENIAYQPDRSRFSLCWQNGKEKQTLPIESPLLGDFNVQNILCAASVALALGIEPTQIQRGVAALKGVLGRMERIDCGQPFLALVDFAHSPASLERALVTLRRLLSGQSEHGPDGRIIAVFGSAGLRDVEKRRLMGRVSGRFADFTVITAEDPRTEDLDAINQEIAAGVLDETTADRYTIVADRAEAIAHAVQLAQPGDIVAAFGKGHERSMCFGTVEHPWNEQEAMRVALRLAGYSG